MTTSMSNVAIVTALPHLKDYFTQADNINFYSRLMLTLPSLVIALLAPILGHIIFKYGKKRSVIIALIVFSISGSAGLYLQTLEMLLFSRAIFGIAVATLMIVSTSLIGDYFKLENRHKFMGYQSAFMALFIIAIGFTGIGLVNNIYLFFITSPILGFGGGIMMTNITAWMLSKTSIKKRVKTSGYFTSAIFLGQFSSPIVFHSLVSSLGVQSFFFTIGISLFLIVILLLLYIKVK